eukprot:3312434-Amphidinium_carterae.1
MDELQGNMLMCKLGYWTEHAGPTFVAAPAQVACSAGRPLHAAKNQVPLTSHLDVQRTFSTYVC